MAEIHSFNAAGEPAAPHSVEAEQQLLGALLNNNGAYEKIAGNIKDVHFYDPIHALIFKTLAERIENGLLASPVTLRPVFENHEGIREIGGPAYLARLSGSAMSSFALPDYVQLIVDLAAKRALLQHMDLARLRVSAGSMSATEIAIKLENGCGKLVSKTSTKPLTQSFLKATTEAVTLINSAYQNETPPGVPTGIRSLNRVLGSFRPSDFIILAGRPSMGKTSVGLNFAYTAAMAGIGVFIASLEMPADQLVTRIVSKHVFMSGSRIPYNQMLHGNISEAQMRDVAESAKAMSILPIETGERDVRELGRLRLAARRAKQKMADSACPLGLVVVDYIQQLEVEGTKSTYERVSASSDGMKSLAMELGVPVIGMAQLSRNVELREPPVPNISDLRESGKLEEDADVVMLCYRNAYYLRKKLEALKGADIEKRADLEAMMADQRYDLQLIVDKNRNGTTETARAYMDMAVCHMADDKSVFGGEHLI